MRQKLYDKNGSEFEVWLSGFAFDVGTTKKLYHPVGVHSRSYRSSELQIQMRLVVNRNRLCRLQVFVYGKLRSMLNPPIHQQLG